MNVFRAICSISAPQYQIPNQNKRGNSSMKLKAKPAIAMLLAVLCAVFSIHLLTIILTGSSFGGHGTTAITGS